MEDRDVAQGKYDNLNNSGSSVNKHDQIHGFNCAYTIHLRP